MKITLRMTAEALGKEVTVLEAKPELTSRQLNRLIIAIQKALNEISIGAEFPLSQ